MKVKLSEITLDISISYNSNSYPSGGMYIVKEEPYSKESESVRYVDKLSNAVLFVCHPNSIIIELEEDEPRVSSAISEEFFLKSLSLVVNRDESYKK